MLLTQKLWHAHYGFSILHDTIHEPGVWKDIVDGKKWTDDIRAWSGMSLEKGKKEAQDKYG